MNDDPREFWDMSAHLAMRVRMLERQVTTLRLTAAWLGLLMVVIGVAVIFRL